MRWAQLVGGNDSSSGRWAGDAGRGCMPCRTFVPAWLAAPEPARQACPLQQHSALDCCRGRRGTQPGRGAGRAPTCCSADTVNLVELGPQEGEASRTVLFQMPIWWPGSPVVVGHSGPPTICCGDSGGCEWGSTVPVIMFKSRVATLPQGPLASWQRNFGPGLPTP